MDNQNGWRIKQEMAIEKRGKLYVLNTAHTTYAFFEDDDGILVHLYWGKRISRIEDFDTDTMQGEQGFHPNLDKKMEECSSYGCMRYKETSIKLEFADGVRDFRYRVLKSETEGNHLTICLKDIYYSFETILHYVVHEEEDIIETWREVRNTGKDPVILERINSGEFTLPGEGFRIINSNGTWADEFKWKEDTLNSGKKVYENLRGATAHVAVPGFVVYQDAAETRGEVWFGVLAYSGNFKLTAEQTPYRYLNLQLGINDTDFSWTLHGKETFTTPKIYAGFAGDGFFGMSARLDAFAHRCVMPKETEKKPLRVLYNSWEAVDFRVTCEKQQALAQEAAKLGVELFVVDDGWFGQRDSDHLGLGDWYVNRKKFPDGLKPLIDTVTGLGMDFGIWIEPEMVNENSDLYRAHPDWIYRYPTRPVLEGRYQYMLDLTNPEVIAFTIDWIDRLLKEHNISYIKWDMNRAMGECASAYLPKEEYRSIWYRHVQGFYTIIRTLRSLHPKVEFEACASGGGRVDYGTMAYFDEFWTSDNTDPVDRLRIQEFYSLLYPAKYMRAWITDAASDERRRVPFWFKAHCAMCGALGIGVNLFAADDAQKEALAEAVRQYKEIRDLVQYGTLTRLSSIRTSPLHALQYEKDGRAVVFAFQELRPRGEETQILKLKHLKEEIVYHVAIEGKEQAKSGAYLMYHGIELKLGKDFDSRCIVLEPKED